MTSSVPVLEQLKNMQPADQAVHTAMRMAERLEELNQAMGKDLKCRILVSASTFDKLREVYPHEKVEHVKVKGKAEPMTLYRIFARQQARERETATTT